VWVPLAGDEAHVVGELRHRGWQVRPGSAYAVDPAHSRPALRLTTSAMSTGDATRFAKALAAAIRLSAG
jgi:DNA-binding transcriptional MocR family regulator